MRADQRALELGPQFGADVAHREGAEAGGDAVHGAGLGGEGVDPGPGRGHLGEGVRADLHPGPAAGDGEDILGADVGLADLDDDTVHIHMHILTR